MKQEVSKQNKRLRSGDKIVVTAGNDRGKTGEILRRVGNDRVIVQGLNVRKKHVRRSESNPNGGVVEMEASMHISNVMLAGEGDKPVKLKVQDSAEGRNIVYQQGGNDVVHRAVKQPAK